MRTARIRAAMIAAFIGSLLAVAAAGEGTDTGTGGEVADDSIGPETELPLPRFVSLKSDEANLRRGPSLSHRIDWVLVRRNMPLQVTAEYEHWRRVTDRDGITGWVHYALISGSRTVIIETDRLPLLMRAMDGAPAVAELERGVIARVEECSPDWCRLSAGGYRGWARKGGYWGVEPDEVLD